MTGQLKGLSGKPKSKCKLPRELSGLLTDAEVIIIGDTATTTHRLKTWKATAKVYEMTNVCEGLYERLCEQDICEEIVEQIEKDIPRTYPGCPMFSHPPNTPLLPIHSSLRRMLHAYAAMDHHVGYVQGISFIAGIPLMLMDEESAFWTLVHIMQKLEIRQYFLPRTPTSRSFPRLHESNAIFEKILQRELPELVAHLKAADIEISVFCNQWFLTLFSYNLEIETTQRLWDFVMDHGHDFLFAFALAVMSWHASSMLACGADDKLLQCVASACRTIEIPPHWLFIEASRLFPRIQDLVIETRASVKSAVVGRVRKPVAKSRSRTESSGTSILSSVKDMLTPKKKRKLRESEDH